MAAPECDIPCDNHAALKAAMPQQPLYGADDDAGQGQPGWLLSPEPYALTAEQGAQIAALGPQLHHLARATETLYRAGEKDASLRWVRQVFDAGKPPALLQYAAMKRFKNRLPVVIRPDLLVTPQGFVLSEIDSVPGGIGFTSALDRAYRALGFTTLGAPQGMAQAFLATLCAQAPEVASPVVAIVVSDEADDYRLEMTWLVETLQVDYPNLHLIHPRQLMMMRDRLGFDAPDGTFTPVDVLYRFFELFDLPNIPQMDLIQYAIKKGLVATPPFKPWLEEKLVLALLHHPSLKAFWRAELGETDFAALQGLVPESWLLDPAPVPPMAAVTPALLLGNETFRQYGDLKRLTQKQRELVIKPSGFSPLAWGSRGVRIGHDLPQPEWERALTEALDAYPQNPHVLQRFAPSRVAPYRYYQPESGALVSGEGRTRLCPYYFVTDDTPVLAGVLATTVPKDKKIIHGMRDGVMAPAQIYQS